MKLYIKGDYTKKIPYGYMTLAGKMWFPEMGKEQVSYSNAGDDRMLQEDFYISLKLNKFEDEWLVRDKYFENPLLSQLYESISLEFIDGYKTKYQQKGEYLRIVSDYLELLTVDKRAMYIMAIEVATAIDGEIREDDKVSWLSVEEFKLKHATILALSFEKATELSLVEIKTIEPIEEPFWEAEERRKVAYEKWMADNTFGF